MSEAEVGVFVQRLRGLMNEIGEGPGVRRRRAFRGPCWSQPHPTHHSKDRTVSVVSSVERQMIGGGRGREQGILQGGGCDEGSEGISPSGSPVFLAFVPCWL